MNTKNTSSRFTPGILETMTIDDVKAFRPQVIVIPIGSTEPHGPHLPYGTDTFMADGISAEAVRLANQEGARVLRLPPLPIGNNVNFKDLPFACRIRVETLMTVLMDLVTYGVEEGVRKFVIFNCHGGNEAAMTASLRQIFDRFQNTAFVSACTIGSFSSEVSKELFLDGSPHAGDFETSLMQFLAPEIMPRVRPVSAPLQKPSLEALAEGRVVWVRNWAHLMPGSFAGEPGLATAEKGEQFFRAETAGFARFLIELSNAAWHPRFPFAESENL